MTLRVGFNIDPTTITSGYFNYKGLQGQATFELDPTTPRLQDSCGYFTDAPEDLSKAIISPSWTGKDDSYKYFVPRISPPRTDLSADEAEALWKSEAVLEYQRYMAFGDGWGIYGLRIRLYLTIPVKGVDCILVSDTLFGEYEIDHKGVNTTNNLNEIIEDRLVDIDEDLVTHLVNLRNSLNNVLHDNAWNLSKI